MLDVSGIDISDAALLHMRVPALALGRLTTSAHVVHKMLTYLYAIGSHKAVRRSAKYVVGGPY